jgi:DNA-binding NtrC family response regulator
VAKVGGDDDEDAIITASQPSLFDAASAGAASTPSSAPRLSLLVVEDERALAALWATELRHLVDATLAHTLADAREKLRGRPFDVILLDLHLPDGFGLDLLAEVAAREEGAAGGGGSANEAETAVIIMTGNADLSSAIQALRLGATDYLLKPCKITELEQHLRRLARERRLRDENASLRQQIRAGRPAAAASTSGPRLIGASPALAEVRRLVARVAPANASVLIQGETGTGKEVTAHLIHAQSARASAAFVPINCAALPRELAESELFGHRKGSFTGADRDHRGLVQAAAGGILFLDEIGDLSVEIQAKFLRLLESGEARRVGDAEPYRVDVRVVAATNRDLRRDVADGRFRQDLFYRLATIEIRLPALRQIPDDVPAIARHFLETLTVPGSPARRFSAAGLRALQGYGWPGNVRELRNVVERAKILCDVEEVGPECLMLPTLDPTAAPVTKAEAAAGGEGETPLPTLAAVEQRMIHEALKRFDGNKTAAARSLGISLRTLYNKLETREPQG